MTSRSVVLALLVMLTSLMTPRVQSSAFAAEAQWDGLWFECEYSGKKAPPRDDCAMLDDDGFMFSGNQVTYMKVIDSPETDACKKKRKGQCFQATHPAITVVPGRGGEAELTPTSIGIRYMLCTQHYQTSDIGGYIEARPDADRCFWAGEKYFYLRRYEGTITVEE